MKKRILGLLIIGVLLLLGGCSGNQPEQTTEESSKTKASTTESNKDERSEMEKRIEDIMQSMSLEEKVGQLFLVRVPLKNQVTDIQNYHLGGYLLFDRDMQGENRDSLKAKIENYQEASKIPLLIGSDEEGGTVSRLSRNQLVSPPFASPQQVYQAGGWAAITEDIDHKAATFHELGIQLGMFPDADVSTDPASFIHDRTIGMDAKGTSKFVQRSVTEMKKQKIGSTLKHFPGYGDNRDSHVEIVTDDRPLAKLQQNDFLPFKAGIKAGADSVMVSHNIISAIDDQNPASISPAVHKVLRKDLGFDGVVMTDDMDMAGLADFISQQKAGLQALKAGNDLILSSSYAQQIPYILQAIQQGDYSEKQVDRSVERVLRWKIELGLL
ncbi:beta-N-acetylhexosaminidase [Enterococcus florum]|uniref:beta-N-acetylhexosaminidase n=1 Tax=Enterococcus florum TaxID=2480627 RepID=A0A4P5PCT0_9ENTE|nr:glycoside hydrolase family 3 N-terminal domain-containing protein [Enterococcus florum]GCF93282.1 beta-N-acetylhexosaminidase [Enterococcus florum]